MFPLLTLLSPIFSSLIDRLFPDKVKADEAKLAMQQELDKAQAQVDAADAAKIESASKVIVAEASSGNWMATNWRPCLMFLFMGLIANQFFLFPILKMIGLHIDIPPLPNQGWDLLQIGLGGYVIGRTGEKMMSIHTDGKTAAALASNAIDSKQYFDAVRKVEGPLSQAQIDQGTKILDILNR